MIDICSVYWKRTQGSLFATRAFSTNDSSNTHLCRWQVSAFVSRVRSPFPSIPTQWNTPSSSSPFPSPNEAGFQHPPGPWSQQLVSCCFNPSHFPFATTCQASTQAARHFTLLQNVVTHLTARFFPFLLWLFTFFQAYQEWPMSTIAIWTDIEEACSSIGMGRMGQS